MSKHLLSVFLRELHTLRLTCKGKDCGVVAELPIGKLIRMKDATCPVCGAAYIEDDNAALVDLARAIVALNRDSSVPVDIEFVMQVKGSTAQAVAS